MPHSLQEYTEAEASSAMKRMIQHHAANGWGDDTAQPANVPAPVDDSPPASAGEAGTVSCCAAEVHGLAPAPDANSALTLGERSDCAACVFEYS